MFGNSHFIHLPALPPQSLALLPCAVSELSPPPVLAKTQLQRNPNPQRFSHLPFQRKLGRKGGILHNTKESKTHTPWHKQHNMNPQTSNNHLRHPHPLAEAAPKQKHTKKTFLPQRSPPSDLRWGHSEIISCPSAWSPTVISLNGYKN